MKFGSGKFRIWLFALVMFVSLLVFAAVAGRFLIVDAPQRSDVIVVLAGETDKRPALGLQLLRQGYAPRMVLNVPAAATIYDTNQLELARQYVQKLPENSAISLCAIRGLSTRDEARDVKRCLAGDVGQSILVVTSDFHTRRALSIFRHEFRGKTISIAAARDPAEFGERWWTHRQWAKICLDEWLRMIWWKGIEDWR